MPITSIPQTASNPARDEVRISNNQSIILLANRAEGAAGCARATTATQAKTVNSISYLLDGAWQTALAGTDNFWTFSGTTVAASSWQKYYLCVTSGGTASVIQGVQSTVSAATVAMPYMPQSTSIFGVLTIATDATHTFIPGTTALNATGITATFVDGVDPSSLMLISR